MRVKARDDVLLADCVRSVGYAATCSCGWRGRVKRSWSLAVDDLREHRYAS